MVKELHLLFLWVSLLRISFCWCLLCKVISKEYPWICFHQSGRSESLLFNWFVLIWIPLSTFLLLHRIVLLDYCLTSYPMNVIHAYCLTLKVPGDELKWVRLCSNDDFVAMASHNGMVMLSQCSKASFWLCYFHFFS